MRTGSLTATAEDCNLETLTRMQELGDKLKVTSTPTIFFPSGRRLSRALAADEIDELLTGEAAAPNKTPPVAKSGR